MSNETTLDDVLALLADWRDQAKRLRNEVPNLRDGSDKRFDSARDADCAADELEALLPAIKAALEDARRYRWLRERLDSVDFEYGDPRRTVLAFGWPENVRVGADLDRNIDAAQEVE